MLVIDPDMMVHAVIWALGILRQENELCSETLSQNKTTLLVAWRCNSFNVSLLLSFPPPLNWEWHPRPLH